jgi:hypothetical protein
MISFLALAVLQAAAFRADVTPAMGEPNIWVTPAAEVLDPLWAKGVVVQNGRERYVIAAIDWCGTGGITHRHFRAALAAGAGTTLERVALQAVHQHTAPYIVADAYALLPDFTAPSLRMSEHFLATIAERLRTAAAAAVRQLQPVDQIGTGLARVERVASARRIHTDGAKLLTRFSTSGKDPRTAALPEGDIDPLLRTVTLARAGRPVARLHFYATHPQTFCCDGRVSGDFVAAAREAFEKEDGAPQIYFTGAAGDVTVGKYNDETPAAREALATRLHAALAAAAQATRYAKTAGIAWRTVELRLPAGAPREIKGDPAQRLRAAIHTAYQRRTEPLPAASLRLGPATLLFLPGEPMLEFQRYAVERARGRFVAFAGYGDIAPGYLCTDEAYREGGYEPSAAAAGPGAEARVEEAIRTLLQRE